MSELLKFLLPLRTCTRQTIAFACTLCLYRNLFLGYWRYSKLISADLWLPSSHTHFTLFVVVYVFFISLYLDLSFNVLFFFSIFCVYKFLVAAARLYRFGLRAAFHWTRVFFLPLYERVCVFADLLFVRLLIAATNLMNCPWGDRCTENGEVSQC